MPTSRALLTSVALAALVSNCVSSASANILTDTEVLNAFRSRREKLRSFVVEYSRHDEWPPTDPGLIRRLNKGFKRPGLRLRASRNPEDYSCTFRFLDGLARYETTGNPPHLSRITAMLKGRVESFRANQGVIVSYPQFSPRQLVDVALGLRVQGDSHFLNSQFIRRLSVSIIDENRASLGVFWWHGKPYEQIKHVWTVDKRHGFAVDGYERIVNGEPVEVIRCSDFSTADGVVYPNEIQYVNKFRDRIVQRSKLEVAKFSVADETNTLDALPIVWPEKAGTGWRRVKVLVRDYSKHESHLGITLKPDEEGRAVVTSVTGGLPASAAGIMKGDLIVSMNGSPAINVRAAMSILRRLPRGRTVNVQVIRQSEEKSERLSFDIPLVENVAVDHTE